MSFFKRNKYVAENEFESIDSNSLKDFIDYSSFPIIRVNLSGKLLYANQAFAKMLLYSNKTELHIINLKNNLLANKDIWEFLIADLNKKDKLEMYLVDL